MNDCNNIDVGRFDFGDAISAMKMGYIVARENWNGRQAGKAMGIVLAPSIMIRSIQLSAVITVHEPAQPCICLIIGEMGRGTIQPGWVASQPDMLATDWVFPDEFRSINMQVVAAHGL